MRRMSVFGSVCAMLIAAAAQPAFAQLSPSATWAAHAANDYQVVPNVTYLTASNYESKLDVYQRRGATTPQPTVVYFHGGFWAAGTKEGSLMSLIPWMEMGWNVVNVEYRLARVAPAPAAVEDCLCALRFLAAQAKTYNIDTNRLVVTGESAGGHLTLTSAMIPESAGLDRQCANTGTAVPKVAAAINWFGITDVADVIDGPHRANLAVTWLGGLPNRDEIARRVSPLTYVRAGPAADPDHSRRHGSARPLRPRGAAAPGADESGRPESAVDDSRRQARQLHAGGAHEDFHHDPRIPREERPRQQMTRDITRRGLLQGAAIGALSLASGIERVFGQSVSRPPNIVFILADDLGYADVSCYGRRDFTTPNIDRIAARGMRFLQGYANSAVCSATRLALITGRYQYRLRLGLEEPWAGNAEIGLPPEHPTLPSLLKKAGLRHQPDRQVASGRPAEIRSAQERL